MSKAKSLPSQLGLCYAMDFVHGRLANGRRFKWLTMTDPYSNVVPVIEVDSSMRGERVCRILDRIFAERALPEVLLLDYRPEFSGHALNARVFQHGVTVHFIQPGKPAKNAFVECLNGKFRDVLERTLRKVTRRAAPIPQTSRVNTMIKKV
jgi:putative transposase